MKDPTTKGSDSFRPSFPIVVSFVSSCLIGTLSVVVWIPFLEVLSLTVSIAKTGQTYARI